MIRGTGVKTNTSFLKLTRFECELPITDSLYTQQRH